MKIKLLAIVISICSALISQGQIEDYKTTKVIPASPTSAALGKYGDNPVSLFNGTPSISIPLYDIKTPGHSLNITLSYDASGTRVNQDATWVGLGWSLLAGGTITRTILQKDDLNESERGFNRYFSLPDVINDSTRESYFDDVYMGYTDVEPDIFSYNFCGRSGRFVMGKNGDGNPVFQDQRNELEILIINYDSWIITDGMGYKYYFGTREQSINYFHSGTDRISDFRKLSFQYSFGGGYLPFSTDYISTSSAWYLDSVVAQTGEVLKFTYAYSSSLSPVSVSESSYRVLNLDNDDCTVLGNVNFDDLMNLDKTTLSYSRQDMATPHVKKIEFSNGAVEFKMGSRLDIETDTESGTAGAYKLDSIIVKNSDSVKIKSFAFNYSYFNSANIQGRLKLDSIVEIGSSGEKLPPYKFAYYKPDSLPPKNSNSIDHWGYWNGVPNQSILSYSFATNAFGQIQVSVPYGSRNADEIRNYPMNGVLNAITYPTGGSSNFEYELNEFGDLAGDMIYNTVYKKAVAYNHDPPNVTSEPVVEFTIPTTLGLSEIPLSIQTTYQNLDPINGSLPDSSQGWVIAAQLQKINESGTVLSTIYSFGFDQILTMSGTHSGGASLTPGKYRISVLPSTEWLFRLEVSWIGRDSVGTRKGGGIRIKSIKSVDSIGAQTVKKYIYKNNQGKTTGLLFRTPKYDARFWVNAEGQEPHVSCFYKMDLYTIRASNIFPSGLTSGAGIIGYKQVTEIEGENGENGKTVYYYHCGADYANPYFPGIPYLGDPFNGKPDSVFVYDSSGAVVKRNNYKYKGNAIDSLRAVKLYAMPSSFVAAPGNAYEAVFYDNLSFWVTPDEETEILYANNNAITTTKKFFYDNPDHRQLTRERVVNSIGDTLITKYKRPDDYTVTGGNPFVEQMRDKHIITPVIEQQTLLKQGATSKLVSGTFATFSKFNNQFFKPSVVYSIKTTSPLTDTTASSFAPGGQPSFHTNYNPKLYFDEYQTNGNLTSLHERNNMAKSYIWGYNNVYPIAEALNTVPKDIFHTSFEEGDGNSSDGDSKTGRKSKTNGYSKSLSSLTNGDYILSYWRKNAGVWSLKKDTVTVSGGTYPIAIDSTYQVDEVRFYPKSTKMTTYTYEPLIGMTSQCDANNRITYYEYDGLGRLKTILDQDRKVLKTYEYQYRKNNNQ